MPLITTVTIRNAVRRALDAKQKCRVRYITCRESATEGCYAFEVFCPNGHRHVVTLTRDMQGRLHSECQIPDDAEMCPSEIGKRLCWHVASALPLFLVLEEGSIGRRAGEDQDGQVEIAVLLDGPLPQPSVKVLRFTEREFKTPGGAVRDRRCSGIQF